LSLDRFDVKLLENFHADSRVLIEHEHDSGFYQGYFGGCHSWPFVVSNVSNVLNFAFCVGSMNIFAAEVACFRAQRAQMVAPENLVDDSENVADVRGTVNTTEVVPV
jgi:hypothetical protein